MEVSYELTEVLKELHSISGFRISVFDTEFNEIAAYPREQSPFCRLIKENPRTSTSCAESDRIAFERVRNTKRVYLYQCSFGLYDAVAPLYSFGELTGYLMMGQTIDSMSSSREFVCKNASGYFEDKERLSKAVQRIHIRAKENILSCISIMGICAEYITLTNRLSSTTHELPERIKKFIDGNYQKQLSINLLCGHFFCSRATLINAFKMKYNVTINRYITIVRMKNACEMLARTAKPVGEISILCGYNDQNYFSKAFSKEIGKTPTQYRESRGLNK